jgi:hypothetical protein
VHQPLPTATGLVVTGTSAQPVLYVSSSDPRYGGGTRGDLNLDTNSGMVSRLTWNAATSTWVKKDLVRGLPRSEENHAVNGMVLDKASNTLYLTVGGHTNQEHRRTCSRTCRSTRCRQRSCRSTWEPSGTPRTTCPP